MPKLPSNIKGTTTRRTTSSAQRRTTPTRRAASGTRRRKKKHSSAHELKMRLRLLAVRLSLICGVALAVYFFYIYVVERYHSKWQALYGNEVYPEGYSIHGIDISHHQGEINWEKLANASVNDEPISFVFIKATEGKSHLDENFNDNFYQAREHGLLRGAYHYFKPNILASDQAKYFLKQVHLEEGDLPPVLDIEETGGLTPEQLRKASLTWLKLVEKQYHTPPILYTNYKFKKDYLNTKEFDHYPYWIAHYYVRSLTYNGKWRFWQHTDCGRIDGIQTKVDLNIYNGSMYELRHLCIE